MVNRASESSDMTVMQSRMLCVCACVTPHFVTLEMTVTTFCPRFSVLTGSVPFFVPCTSQLPGGSIVADGCS
jgi:hypothetical protein